MEDKENELGAFLAGFVIGALVGAATALILAPQSGPATRQQLMDVGSDLRHSADSQVREYRDRAGSLVADTRNRAQQITDQVQDQVRIVLDAGKDQATQVADDLSNGNLTSQE
jgi:gas vesicle protein